MRRVSLLVVSLILALPAAAQVYQWRDAQGRINYSDTPPPAGAAKAVKSPSRSRDSAAGNESEKSAESADGQGTPATAEGAANEPGKTGTAKTDPAKPKTTAEKETEFRQRRVAAAEAEAKVEKERQRAAEMARACSQARSQMVGLNNSHRVTRFNSEGQRELLDNTERAAEIERSQKFIDENCK